MKARVALIGPHGVGKSSLAKALAADASRAVHYEVERIVTSRQRRPGEDDQEYLFVTQEEFDTQRSDFLLVQENRGVAWNYALQHDRPLVENTIRLYVVLPETAALLQQRFPGEMLVIAVLPPSLDVLQKRLTNRDATIPEDELSLRLGLSEHDSRLSQEIADEVFYNNDTIAESAAALGSLIEQTLEKQQEKE